MGGKGSGGRRARAGRPRRSAYERDVTGNPGKRGRVLAHPSSPSADPATVSVEEFDAPDSLTTDERLVWLRLAPDAFKLGTLDRAKSLAFEILCRNVVLEQRYARSVTDQGSANHRGMIQRVDAELDAFGLRPNGKRTAQTEPAAPEKAAANYW
jgi:hypothetical protein